MSTSTLAFSQENIEWLIKETKNDLALSTLGTEGRDAGICPYVTFYVYHQAEEYLTLADKLIAIWHEFQTIIDEPFRKLFKSRTQVWLKAGDKRFPVDLRAEAEFENERYESFYLMGTDMDSPDESPRWSYSASVTHVPEQGYSRLKLTFRRQWYVDNHQQQWKDFIHACVTSLQPEQCYMGFEVGKGGLSVMGAYESDVLERICADYLYGMDIDHPSNMGFHYHDEHREGFVNPEKLGSGLRPPTWCFMLSPVWQRKLGKNEAQIRAELDDPRIRITAIPYATNSLNPDGANGLWIELGELDLYPVENGVPDLLVKANRLIRPIRCDGLNLLTLHPWDGDPNPRFDYESSRRWLARFDEDSDWPNPQLRKEAPPASYARDERVLGGQSCPRTGWWFTPAKSNSRAFFQEGDIMPNFRGNDYGTVIWQWDADQRNPSL